MLSFMVNYIDGNGNDNEQSNRGWADMGLDLDVDNIMVNPVNRINDTYYHDHDEEACSAAAEDNS